MARPAVGEITQALDDWNRGDEQALIKLTPLVYRQLYRIARRYGFSFAVARIELGGRIPDAIAPSKGSSTPRSTPSPQSESGTGRANRQGRVGRR
jgi:hypothetical protein